MLRQNRVCVEREIFVTLAEGADSAPVPYSICSPTGSGSRYVPLSRELLSLNYCSLHRTLWTRIKFNPRHSIRASFLSPPISNKIETSYWSRVFTNNHFRSRSGSESAMRAIVQREAEADAEPAPAAASALSDCARSASTSSGVLRNQENVLASLLMLPLLFYIICKFNTWNG